jgi:lysophospholipase L1-like esterase
MDDGAVREMCDAIERVARDLGCGLIDVNAATAGHPEAFRFDGVHPQAAGARLIAQAVYEAIA